MRSLSPNDYESLPRLDAPAGYIFVIRDIDHETFRIDQTTHPATLINAIVDESAGEFGFELVSILKTEDLRASEALLYERHHARLSEEWHVLDDYQREELRRSFLETDAHRNLYLRPRRNLSHTPQQTQAPAVAAPQDELRYGTMMTTNIGSRGILPWRARDQSDPPRLRPGRAQNMRSTRQNAQRRAPPFDLSQYLRDRFLTLLINHPFKVMFALALLLLVGLIIGLLHGYQVTHNLTWR